MSCCGAPATSSSYVADGCVKVRIAGTYPLADAAAAHRDLEGRKTIGEAVAEDLKGEGKGEGRSCQKLLCLLPSVFMGLPA